jgi:hypothetical protein
MLAVEGHPQIALDLRINSYLDAEWLALLHLEKTNGGHLMKHGARTPAAHWFANFVFASTGVGRSKRDATDSRES